MQVISSKNIDKSNRDTNCSICSSQNRFTLSNINFFGDFSSNKLLHSNDVISVIDVKYCDFRQKYKMNHPTLMDYISATTLIQKTSEPILESRYAGQHDMLV